MDKKVKEMAKLWVEVNRKTKTQLDFFLHFKTLFPKECNQEWQNYCDAPERYITFDKCLEGKLMKQLIAPYQN